MSPTRLPLLLRPFLLAFGASVLCVSSLVAQNDDCAGAIALVDGVNGPFNNGTATSNPADPAFTCGGTARTEKDLWFTYTPAVGGTATIETCALAAFDTRIQAYSGACGALVSIVCNDDACSLQSRVSFTVFAGSTYRIRVAGFGSASGSFSLLVASALPDECATAATIVNGANGPFPSGTATTSAPAFPCAGGGNDLWFRYVASCTGAATASLCGSSFDTLIQAFSGTCAALVSLGCNDDSCGLQSSLSFAVVSGTTYFIRAGGFGAATGSIQITMSCSGPPTNDLCTLATTVVLGANGPYSTVLSTSTTPQACGFATNDVWFRFVAPCSADYRFETCGSTYDSVVELFSGSCTGLTSLACNDDSCGLQSRVSGTLTQGQTYFLLVGGFSGATGSLTVTVSGAGTYAHDECAGATAVVTGDNGPYSSIGATTSTPGMACGSGGCDLWHSFTAPCNGNYVFETCGSSYDTVLQVYSGGCGSLTSLGCNDDFCGLQSRVTTSGLLQGQTYYLRVGGFNGAQGTYRLRATLTGGMGTFTPIVTGCGALTLTASGAPTLGGTLSYSMTGALGTPYLWFGSAIGPISVCPPNPCAVGADFSVVASVTSAVLLVPCDLSVLGGSLACQGADLQVVAGACPIGGPISVSFTDTIVTTIN